MRQLDVIAMKQRAIMLLSSFWLRTTEYDDPGFGPPAPSLAGLFLSIQLLLKWR